MSLLPRLLLLALVQLLPLSAAAESDDAPLLEAVHAFLYERSQTLGDEVMIEVHPPTAQFPACESPTPFIPGQRALSPGRVSVGVRCGADGRQVRYLQAQLTVFGDYPVAARQLRPGERLGTDDLRLERGDLSRLPHQAVTEIEAALGLQLTRPVNEGRPLLASMLRAEPLVERRQRVVVEARGQGFRVSREGEALDEGGRGERVRVRLSGREIIEAEVIGPGRLAVRF
ncbi:flagellar basal body P-ring formation chaperone FlgA [Halomonas salifodinae]|uniref:flagellar basal body P-ring formation chaperone FlgA n=1 Tax=Halomonas salifodinae TaxID=438745 RepID=UPI0033B13A73